MNKTIKIRKFCSWFLFGLMTFDSFALLAETHSLADCPNGQTETRKNEISIDPRFKPQQDFKQGPFGSCFGFAAAYLLEYLYNEYRYHFLKSLNLIHDEKANDEKAEANKIEGLSPLSVIGNGCDRNLVKANEGGFAWEVLYKLQKRPGNEISTTKDMPYHLIEKLNPNDQWIAPGCEKSSMAVLNEMNLRLNLKDIDMIKHINEVSKNPDTYHFDLIDYFPHTKLKMPPYNLYVTSTHTTKESQEKVREHFERAPPRPLSLFTEGHYVVITDIRSHYCGDDYHHDEWHIVDSDGGVYWEKAEVFSEPAEFVNISPCGTTEEPCVKDILSDDAFGCLTQAGDLKDVQDYFDKNHLKIKEAAVCTAVFYAIYSNKIEILQFITEKFPNWLQWMDDGSCYNKDIPHAIAHISDVKILDFLHTNFPSIFAYTNKNGQTVAHEAIESRNINVVKFLASNYPNSLKQKNHTGLLPIHLAAMYGHFDMLKELAKFPLNLVAATDQFKNNIAHYAVLNKFIPMLVWIAQNHSYLLNQENENHETPLSMKVDKKGRTLAHLAAFTDDIELLKILKKHAPYTFTVPDRDGKLPKDLAAEFRHTKALQFLRKARREPKKSHNPHHSREQRRFSSPILTF